MSPSPVRFPHLENVPEGARDRFEERLRQESNDMINKFAILVVKTKKGMEERGTKVRDVKILLKNCACIRAYKACKKHTNFDKLVLRLSDYWSFFDYEILNVMVATHCPHIADRLNKYEEDFRHYCKRRLCEVPRDGIGIKLQDHNRLRMKCDDRFGYKKTKLWDVKVLTLKLAALLNTKLALRSIKKGCIILSFTTFTDVPFPLTAHQKRELRDLGILLMYNADHVFFDSKDPADWDPKDEDGSINQSLLPSLEVALASRKIENVEEDNVWTEACHLGAGGFFREKHDSMLSTGSSSIGASPYASSFSDTSDPSEESSDEDTYLPDGRKKPSAESAPEGVIPGSSLAKSLTFSSTVADHTPPGTSVVDAHHPLLPQSLDEPDDLPTDLPKDFVDTTTHSTPKKDSLPPFQGRLDFQDRPEPQDRPDFQDGPDFQDQDRPGETKEGAAGSDAVAGVVMKSKRALSPEASLKHKAFLRTMDCSQVLRVLNIMGLEEYASTFEEAKIDGEALVKCDNATLKDELNVTSDLHRMRFQWVIEGAYPIQEIMENQQ